MIKKQSIARETVPPVKAKKAAAPRVKAAKHRTIQPKVQEAEIEVIEDSLTDSHEAIAKLAYGFWEQRGYRDGDSLGDWLRAEAAYRQSL